MNNFKLILSYFLNAPFTDYIFYIIMVIVAILSKYCYKKRELLVNSIAAIGMIGTFFGICVALQKFNSADITSSVPELLSGMKTAFYTSLIGTGGSVALKVLYGLKGTKLEPVEQEFFDNNKKLREQNSELILLNKELLFEIKNIKEYNSKQLSSLEKLITNQNSNTTSINNKLENIKETLINTNNLIECMNIGFNNFKTSMAKENNEAFTEAIGACVKNLNKEMMEQLGENFNKFNEGMFRLITWQEKYIEIIKQTEDNQNKIVNTFKIIEEKLSQAAGSVVLLGEKSESIIFICENIGKTIENLTTATDNANSSEEKLKETIKGITSINNELAEFKDILGNVIKNTSEANKIFNETVINSKEEISDINNELVEYNINTKKMHSLFLENMGKELDSAVKNINELNNALKKECISIASNTATGMEITNKKVGELLEKHINNIETELGKTLTSSLISLGEELASLSEKFVEDYTPLTEKLREVVRIAEKVR